MIGDLHNLETVNACYVKVTVDHGPTYDQYFYGNNWEQFQGGSARQIACKLMNLNQV